MINYLPIFVVTEREYAMKNKLNMSLLATLVMICSGGAFAESKSVALSATLNVEAEDTCIINVSTVGKTTWSPTWKLAKNSQSGEIFKGSSDDNEPLFVKVALTDSSSANCSLKELKFGADSPSTHLNDGSGGAYAVVTQHGGAWRYMPVATKLQLFTDVEGTQANAVALNKVTVSDAAGASHSQSESALHTAMTEIKDIDDFGQQVAIPLTNNYLSTNGVVPLNTGGGNTALSYSLASDYAGSPVKNALIGVGVLLAKNPESDGDGQTYLRAVENGETVSMPFTLNVSLP